MSDHENDPWYRDEYGPREIPDLDKNEALRIDGDEAYRTPRELFEAAFGKINDERWQWLKEFVALYAPNNTER